MKDLADAILKDMLPTVWLRLIAGAIAPLLVGAWAIPKLLDEIGLQIPQQQKPLLLATLIVSVVLLWLIVLLVSVVFQHRSSRLSSEQFAEYRGAFFKRKPGGGYHEVVYCGSCKTPTAINNHVKFLHEQFVCKCGWKSSFNLGEFNAFFPTLHP
ncbi:MAG: hypothetical protein ABIK08_00605 [Pseudomonadota bacterium]